MWLRVNNCCKEAVACLNHDRVITGIMSCHQTGGPITWWAQINERAYNQDFTVILLATLLSNLSFYA